ncbi:MAG TPA: hypothetical protein VKJ65_10795, partial [Phycisphaerae bacterium]|nr:hypothetical protein [Phycisphaerae bacterium]
SSFLYTLHFHPAYSTKAICHELVNWRQRHASPLKKFIRPHTNDRDPERRLKIGYVSPDFYAHVVGWNLLPLFQQHNHEQWEIFAYSAVVRPDEWTRKIRSCCDVWRDIAGIDDQKATQMIRDDKIDILIDLALHTAGNRLLIFAQKPAPVQVTWLGYPGSTGLETIDYRLSDPYLDPPQTDLSVYSEQTVRLPETYWCYQPGGPVSESAPLPALSTGFITFGCLNIFAKVSPAILELWSQILQAIPKSRLLIHSNHGTHLNKVRELFGQKGISADRIEFIGRQPWPNYINTYNRIDISLDPLPYNGGITTCDSLFMGVPVVSLSGQTAVGRAGKSILSNIGLPELVAQKPEEYVEIAVELANDLPRLAKLRRTLRQRMESSPLMDAKRFARNVEAAYRDMWRKWCNSSQ